MLSNLEKLPNELKDIVFTHLGLPDLCVLFFQSRTLNNACQDYIKRKKPFASPYVMYSPRGLRKLAVITSAKSGLLSGIDTISIGICIPDFVCGPNTGDKNKVSPRPNGSRFAPRSVVDYDLIRILSKWSALKCEMMEFVAYGQDGALFEDIMKNLQTANIAIKLRICRYAPQKTDAFDYGRLQPQLRESPHKPEHKSNQELAWCRDIHLSIVFKTITTAALKFRVLFTAVETDLDQDPDHIDMNSQILIDLAAYGSSVRKDSIMRKVQDLRLFLDDTTGNNDMQHIYFVADSLKGFLINTLDLRKLHLVFARDKTQPRSYGSSIFMNHAVRQLSLDFLQDFELSWTTMDAVDLIRLLRRNGQKLQRLRFNQLTVEGATWEDIFNLIRTFPALRCVELINITDIILHDLACYTFLLEDTGPTDYSESFCVREPMLHEKLEKALRCHKREGLMYDQYTREYVIL